MDLINHHAQFQAQKTGGLSDFWLFLPCRVRIWVVAEWSVGEEVGGGREWFQTSSSTRHRKESRSSKEDLWEDVCMDQIGPTSCQVGEGGSKGRKEGLNTVKRS